MTKQQILAEIAAKIDGQGSAIDAGSALPGILRGILEIAVSGGNVQSDWSQTDSAKEDYIKNKPTIPAAQVNSDWNATEGPAEILNKPTIPEGPKVLDIEDFENSKIELTKQEAQEFLQNVHYINLENAQETQGYLFELSFSPSLLETIATIVIDKVEDNNALIVKIFGSETISAADGLVGFADYIAVVNYDSGEKYALVYIAYEQ